MTTPDSRRDLRARPARRRGTVLKLVLASGALLGIGAAATSAAWTNSAFFTSTASSGSVDLKACSSANPAATTPTWTCAAADTSGTAHAILSSSAFALMVPGNTYTTTVRIQNDGNVPLSVTSTITALAQPLTGTAPNATLGVSPAGPITLAAGASQNLTVTVTTPANWDVSHANQTSSAALQVAAVGSTVP
ncbi:hypothetical protein [Cellulomonas composti]|uniref:Uncharacterized protein n=1 Tax=Cellulomonas composti TaxID=266130 RepID=A0A511JD28_9CELL|nr:hypothetical protein [Cellulomonas composti]GEL95874.1 hypothetical protein CCO02nite_25320 [Cellulomonas composti]